MKRLEKRALICLTFAAVLLLGLCIFVYRFFAYGDDWATFYANQSIYTEGRLCVGRIYDRNGTVLCDNTDEDSRYNEDYLIREATVHAVGDMDGNISTGALSAYADKLVGYNVLTGTYSLTGKGNDLKLTIDADACKAAYQALGGRNGCVGVYNYKTGEIVCMVSTPSFDPATHERGDDTVSGMYLNKFLSSKLPPGSIFKLVTTAAAIDNLDNLDSWSYTCVGKSYINDEPITCVQAHGTVDFYGALAKSCNCAYAELTQKIGPTLMKEYVERLGLTREYDIDGIGNIAGSFEFTDVPLNLSWAGIGQYQDMVNPCSMMVYMGAIANKGVAVTPRLLMKTVSSKETTEMLDEDTAEQLTDMMKNNVVETYYEYNFPGLDIYAKSGTAEVEGREPHAWFSGFIKNEKNPYAFIVCVENGGYGSQVAAPVANAVLQEIVNK
ncbi:MAG: penicillin-binding transpeptidase domain-containing protein [Eubacteriaceae bacterium]|nr:penicillin-binding transpeptidase domain-containing protein [Eubacteriaceae bacterium]